MPIRRTLKNVVRNYTDAQVKVREATSNDPWGPSSTLMSEIADLTYNVMAFTEIMQMLWKRLNDHGKNWRHVYKAMVLLDYIVKTGSEKVAQQCKENIYTIQTLKDFQYVEENKDMGMNVREKAKQLVTLLKDDERLKNERAKALKAKERFAQSTVVSMYQRGATSPTSEGYSDGQLSSDLTYMPRSDSAPTALNHDGNPEIDAVRPSTAGEEELQLQLALAMSKEEHDEDERKKTRDDVKLQMALEESRKDRETQERSQIIQHSHPHQLSPPPPSNRETLLELMGTQPGGAAAAPAQNDPWGAPQPAEPKPSTNDPWSSNQGGAPLAMAAPPTNNDPWSGGSKPPATQAPPPTAAANVTNNSQPFAANDPWAAKPADAWAGGAGGPPHTNGNNAFPHQPPAQAPGGGLDEAFDMIGTRSKSPSGQPFDMMGMHHGLEPQPIGGLHSSEPNLLSDGSGKTPESFLGANAGLVNLDNLVTKPTTPVAGPFTATVDFATACQNSQNSSANPNSNPFGSSSIAVNPFGPVAQASRVPLNQMPTSNSPATGFGQPTGPMAHQPVGAPMLQPMPAMGNGNGQPANPFL